MINGRRRGRSLAFLCLLLVFITSLRVYFVLKSASMSRKIGLGDVHFDPDIDGEIDFDFFGDNCVSTSTSNQLKDTKTDEQRLEKSHLNSNSVSYSPLLLNKSEPIDIKAEKRGFRSLMDENESQKRSESEETNDYDDDYNHSGEENGSKSFDMSHRDGLLSFSYRKRTENEHEEEEIGSIGAENGLSSTEASLLGVASASLSGCVSSRDLLRVAATDRFPSSAAGSPSSDSGSDTASDLYSSTDDSFEDYDVNELDSGSEITDVSPLSSANMSPLPESPKRTPEPKNNLNNFTSKFGFKGNPRLQSRKELNKLHLQSSNSKTEASDVELATKVTKNDDTVDLKLLSKAIFELEEERKRNLPNLPTSPSPSSSSFDTNNGGNGRVSCGRSRKNMTFSNDEVRRIEQENKRLLQRIIDSQKPRKTTGRQAAIGKVASSAVNRIRELKKIEVENLAMLKRLHAAKPTKELSRDYLLGTSPRNGSLSVSSSKGPCSPASSRTSGSFHTSNVPRDSGSGRGGRSLSTGSIPSPSGSYSTSSSAFSNRSRSLKLPGGFLSHGQEAWSGR